MVELFEPRLPAAGCLVSPASFSVSESSAKHSSYSTPNIRLICLNTARQGETEGGEQSRRR